MLRSRWCSVAMEHGWFCSVAVWLERSGADVPIIPPGTPPEDGCVMLGLRDGRVYRLR